MDARLIVGTPRKWLLNYLNYCGQRHRSQLIRYKFTCLYSLSVLQFLPISTKLYSIPRSRSIKSTESIVVRPSRVDRVDDFVDRLEVVSIAVTSSRVDRWKSAATILQCCSLVNIHRTKFRRRLKLIIGYCIIQRTDYWLVAAGVNDACKWQLEEN